MFALIGENGQGIGTSSFADWVKNVSNLDLPTDEMLAADELIDAYYAQLDEGIDSRNLNHFPDETNTHFLSVCLIFRCSDWTPIFEQ